MDDTLFTLAGVCAGYGDNEVLHDISIDLQNKVFYGIVGESGCGKTTIARVLSGKLPLSKGQLTRPSSSSLFVLTQDTFSCFDERQTVFSCLREVLQIKHVHQKQASLEQIVAAMSLFGLGEHYLRKRIKWLSGGERQRVALARAYLIEPQFLILDESLDALDMVLKYHAINSILKWKTTKNLGAVFISHDLALVKYCCDTIIVIKDGRIVEVIPSSQVSETNLPNLSSYTQMLFKASISGSTEESLPPIVARHSPFKGCPKI